MKSKTTASRTEMIFGSEIIRLKTFSNKEHGIVINLESHKTGMKSYNSLETAMFELVRLMDKLP